MSKDYSFFDQIEDHADRSSITKPLLDDAREMKKELKDLQSQLARVTAERDALRGFASDIINCKQAEESPRPGLRSPIMPPNSVLEMAVAHGLLAANCHYGFDPTPLLTGEAEE